MADLDDYELDRGPGEEPRRPRGGFPTGLVVAGVLMAIGVGWLGYLAFRRPPPPSAPPPAATPVPAPTESAPVATPAPDLPPLDESDAFVRDLAQGLSPHPQLAIWLATRGLVRTIVAVVANVAEGETPAPHLRFLAPREGLRVIEKRGRLFIDPRSGDGYDAFANAVTSLDAAETARVFRTIEPLFDLAYRELGHRRGGFPKAVDRAIAALLEAPKLEGDVPVVAVVRATVIYEYADKKLEALTPAQKQLLRMGPENVRKIQGKLREVAAALRPPA
jgi:hypothetical protein